ALIALFALMFFRFTGQTGCSVFVIISAALIYLFVVSPAAHLIAFPVLVVLVILSEWRLSKRKTGYLPAIAEIEAGRIKRGLTAPEAAVLLELPLNKVLTLVIFGLLKKGVLKQIKETPIVVDIHEDFKPGPKHPSLAGNPVKYRRVIAQEKGIAIHKYEEPFITSIVTDIQKPVAEIDFSPPMKILIEGVASRMKGFDPDVTRIYYRYIIRTALKQARSIGEIPAKEKAIDRNLGWILMHDDYPTVLSTRGYHYRPSWGGSSPKTGIPSGTGAKTTLGD
ncbi:unnamed protein product, partial [marine sediment metagenome]